MASNLVNYLNIAEIGFHKNARCQRVQKSMRNMLNSEYLCVNFQNPMKISSIFPIAR